MNMNKVINFSKKKKEKNLPAYAECSCGSDTFLLHLNPDREDDFPEVIALECAGCREVIPFETEFDVVVDFE